MIRTPESGARDYLQQGRSIQAQGFQHRITFNILQSDVFQECGQHPLWVPGDSSCTVHYRCGKVFSACTGGKIGL
jgi:hypothetical protein